MSHKFQITLPDDLAAELKKAAATSGIPLAEFIRQVMRENLRQSRSRSSGRKSPLAPITGIVDSDETDLASRVDDILYR
jgi:metal-responsive CopG/Arc/MetJ family transcriptional regulator